MSLEKPSHKRKKECKVEKKILEYQRWLPLNTHTDCVGRIMSAALSAADPVEAIRRHVSRQGSKLEIDNQIYDLDHFKRILVIAFGKASVLMTMSLYEILGDRICDGVVISKHHPIEQNTLPEKIKLLQGNHPVPGEDSLISTQILTNLLQERSKDDLIFCLISGGGSALLTSPVKSISLDDVKELTRQMLTCGATINEINALRKHLDYLKGGELARLAYPAHLVSLILSDVVGSPLDVIASGPTVADPSTFFDCVRILKKYDLEKVVPPNVKKVLEEGTQGLVRETPKAGDKCFQLTQNVLVAENYKSAIAAIKAATMEGFHTLLLTTYIQGEARQAGKILAGILRQVNASEHPLPRPACIVIGGETTVTLTGKGLGGRNLELALGGVKDIAGLPDVGLVTLATDGEDGPTDAAGAWIDGTTFDRAMSMHMDPFIYLKENDSYHFFESLGLLLKPGSTATNVNDMVFLFAY